MGEVIFLWIFLGSTFPRMLARHHQDYLLQCLVRTLLPFGASELCFFSETFAKLAFRGGIPHKDGLYIHP